MKKIILQNFALCFLMSTAAFANKLPPADFSSVTACMNNMNQAAWAVDYSQGRFFDTAANAWGSIGRGCRMKVCEVNYTRVALCNIVSKTNGSPWEGLNQLITEKFLKKARDTINQAIEDYNHGEKATQPLYFTIACQYEGTLDPEKNCTGSVVS